METIYKYPRTHHIEGSRLQPGDEDLSAISFSELRGRHLVVEEKMDGANAGLSFGPDGALRLQSRGHYLTGGHRERHFNLLKRWAATHTHALHRALGCRYLMYGEWLYAKHTVYYNKLPHYFMEFDVLDMETGAFLDTPSRATLLAGLPVVSVRVLHSGPLSSVERLTAMVGPSAFVAPGHTDELAHEHRSRGLSVERALAETDPTELMEGLYVKVEEGGQVVERYKWVRAGFLTAVFCAEGHWQNRPVVPNRLAPGVDIFDAEGPTP